MPVFVVHALPSILSTAIKLLACITVPPTACLALGLLVLTAQITITTTPPAMPVCSAETLLSVSSVTPLHPTSVITVLLDSMSIPIVPAVPVPTTVLPAHHLVSVMPLLPNTPADMFWL